MPSIRRTLFAVSALAILLAGACSRSTEPARGDKGPPPEVTALPRALTPAEQRVLSAGNAFSFALFRQLTKTQAKQNVFVWPLSASMSLGMAMQGATGPTLDAMRTALGVGPGDLQQIGAGYKGLVGLLRGLDASTTFDIANSVWYRSEFPFTQSYLDATRTWFDAEARGLDFDDVPGSLRTINGWVSAKTNGKIPTILDDIAHGEVMFLIDAVYFKGSWRAQFDRARTSPGPFHAADGTTQTVPLMHRDAEGTEIRYRAMPGLAVAELPYGNGAFAMTILLPARGADVDSLAASLTPERWSQLVDGTSATHMGVTLPKFTLSYGRTLNEDLDALGMGIAFTDAADFSGMSPRGRDLAISRVTQKTYVDVDEEGTEAAAVTVTGVQVTALPASLVVDHPFVFAIRERLSGTVLCLGKIVRI